MQGKAGLKLRTTQNGDVGVAWPVEKKLAAVDLGSNSFRLTIGKVIRSGLGEQVVAVDSLKESVRLAAGMDVEGKLDVASLTRALETLKRFCERLRAFEPDAVRVVGTNTLRIATNVQHFLEAAREALGFPIEIIGGVEEARLIYLGAAHGLPSDHQRRLVFDIGGGSTECIVGTDYESTLIESVPVGCVALSKNYFADGVVSKARFSRAVYAASDVLASVSGQFRQLGWEYAVGTSGTAKALSTIASTMFGQENLTRAVLCEIERLLIEAGDVFEVQFQGLKADRRPVLAGGLAAMIAVFDEFGIEQMRYCPTALREGLLYDLIGRGSGNDIREITVEQMAVRYGVDLAHAGRIAGLAVSLFNQVTRGDTEAMRNRCDLLRWAATLGEIGMTVAHDGFHKHSAYLLMNSDMPGFTQSEQSLMSRIALGQIGGLRKLRDLVREDFEWLMILSIRIASILHRHRDGEPVPLPELSASRRSLKLKLPKDWADNHPLTDSTLRAEVETWAERDIFESFEYQTH